MALFIASLNSGSNGNCYYIGNETEAVLIDAGISCRETEIRMKRLGLNMQKVKAIFVSHEHTDHIAGITVLSKKYQLPVYITPVTLQHSGVKIEKHLNKNFTAFEPVDIDQIRVTAFPKLHDGKDPHSFIVQCNEINIGVFTDIGKACENLIYHFKQCHAAFLEANYDTEMLMNGKYPQHLKKRISGGQGHLSNEEALQIILSHLSQNNNKPELVKKLFEEYKHLVEIIVASRYKETEVYEIVAAGNTAAFKPKQNKRQKPVQLSMFK
jgi:phosphoribosyl 1,2-cyclic phosphodiesterase